jgi:hypothetical protein
MIEFRFYGFDNEVNNKLTSGISEKEALFLVTNRE